MYIIKEKFNEYGIDYYGIFIIIDLAKIQDILNYLKRNKYIITGISIFIKENDLLYRESMKDSFNIIRYMTKNNFEFSDEEMIGESYLITQKIINGLDMTNEIGVEISTLKV